MQSDVALLPGVENGYPVATPLFLLANSTNSAAQSGTGGRMQFATPSALASQPSDDVGTPTEHDMLVSRLIARIAELEERLYKKEFEQPTIAERQSTTNVPPGSAGDFQQQQPLHARTSAGPKLKESLLATLRESWARLEGTATPTAQTPTASTHLPMFAHVPTAPSHTAPGSTSKLPAAAAGNGPAHTSDVLTPAPKPRSGLGKPSAAESSATDGGAGVDLVAEADGAVPLKVFRDPSAPDMQAGGEFQFSTHLVVDYSRPNRSSSDSACSGSSLSSVDDDAEYGEAQPGEPRTASQGPGSRARHSEAGPAPSVETATVPAGLPERSSVSTDGRIAAGGAPLPPLAPGPGPTPAPTPSGVTRSQTNARNSSDGGGGGAPSSSGTGGAGAGPSGAASRAAAWSGNMLSKLGLGLTSWRKDRGEQDGSGGGGTGNGMPRNVSAGSLYGMPGMYGGGEAFSEKALEEQLAAGGGLPLMGGGGGGGGGGQYYRYVFDPVDVQAEMEVTARVRRAAAEALMEANAKLAEAQAAQAELQAQLEQAKDLQQELEQLRTERSEAQAAKGELEDQMAAVRSQLEAMKDTETSLQAELESVRAQTDIWRSSKNDEAEKLKQENQLLRNQLTTRLNELQACRQRLSDGDADKQRQAREMEDLKNKVQWLTKINLQLETAAGQLNDARKAAAEWQERFMRERNVRRRLHDQLQQLKGNIRVMCRVRPVQPGQRDIVTYPLEGLLAVSPQDRRYQEYEFDHVFGPTSSQAAVFEDAVSSLVRSCADGYNVCIFAYGQTGSGKTHTMQGPPEDPGIYVRALQELFRIANEEDGVATAAAAAAAVASTDTSNGDGPAEGQPSALAGAPSGSMPLGRFSVCVSMLEIYNEAVHDLLAPGGVSAVAKPLDVSGLGAGELPPGVDRVAGLTWRPVSNTEGVEGVLREGARNRATASTALNAHSSRSHALLSVRVTRTQADGRAVTSIMHLVDLAGSERVDKSEVTGQQLKEAQCINKSLSALGDVISALQRRNAHIPFRNSKLTAVLQDSLCGNSKVLLVCNIAPEGTSSSETLSSLNFASRAAQVELGAARRAAPSERPSPSPSPHDRSPAPEREARSGPTPPPLPIMNGTAAKVRAQAAASGGVRSSQAFGGR